MPARPTTDFAKESLFNILHNHFDFTNCRVLDLFGGTGNIAFEFVSRGANFVHTVEMHDGCIAYMAKTAAILQAENLKILKSEVLRFLKKDEQVYDIIFADPPFVANILEDIHTHVFSRNLLKPGGWLIMEHPENKSYSHLPNFYLHKQYGSVNFSIFVNR